MANQQNEFINLLKNKIKKYENKINQDEIGTVLSISDGVAIVYGLEKAMLNELVIFENGSKGIVLNLDVETVGVIVLEKYEDIKENSIVKRTKQVISVPVGDELLLRVVNGFGQPIDNGPQLNCKKMMPIEKIAPGVVSRQPINSPIKTGILLIDSMLPIGKGQRELIIGDHQTGKTTIAIDTILNQKNENVKCIYVAIGQKRSSIINLHNILKKEGAMKYTTIVAATASDSPASIYIAPYTGMTIAEEWLHQGQDVLIIFDDLSKHAISYRSISLLLHRPPGREAYPGDIFYLHSRLLERAGKLNSNLKGGSITALPIVETQAENISAYIPTNIISITDGQLFMLSSMFNANQRPAIDSKLSVSRIGSSAQNWYIKKLSSSLKFELAQYSELQAFAQFGSNLDSKTKEIIEHGKRVLEILKQSENSPLTQLQEAILLFVIKNHYIKWIPIEYISLFKNELINTFNKSKKLNALEQAKKADDHLFEPLHTEVKKFIKSFIDKIPNYKIEMYGNINELNN